MYSDTNSLKVNSPGGRSTRSWNSSRETSSPETRLYTVGQPSTESGKETGSLRSESRPTAAASPYPWPRSSFEKAARGFGPAGAASKCHESTAFEIPSITGVIHDNGQDQLPESFFQPSEPVQRVNCLIAFAQMVMNSASPALTQSGRQSANGSNGRYHASLAPKATFHQGRRRQRRRRLPIHGRPHGQLSWLELPISGPRWSASPIPLPRSPYRARPRGGEPSVDCISPRKNSFSDLCVLAFV